MRRNELILFLVLIIALNIPLFLGAFSERLIYLPEEVAAGQWWRLVTSPFVHVSWYHLLLDGAAFLLLYAQLAETNLVKRLAYVLGIHAAVVLGVTHALPHVQAVGYCGLSGIAHGLMAVWCLEQIGRFGPVQSTPTKERLIAAVIFAGLLAKSIYENIAGHAFFASTHLGDVGVPIVTAHMAGIVGAAAIYGVFNLRFPLFARFSRKILTKSVIFGKINSA